MVFQPLNSYKCVMLYSNSNAVVLQKNTSKNIGNGIFLQNVFKSSRRPHIVTKNLFLVSVENITQHTDHSCAALF